MASFKDFARKIPVLGSMFGGGPDQQVTPLDSATKGLINENINRSINETPDDISKQILQGVEPNVSALGMGPEMTNREAVRTGQDPYMMSALSNKFRQNTAKDYQRFKSQTDAQSRLMKGQRMADASQMAFMKQQVQTNNFAMLSQAFQQNEMARAQVISSFIGLGTNAAMLGQLPQGSTKQTQSAINAFNSGQDNLGSMFQGNNNTMMA
jgi:hypothetical protein